MIDNRPAGFQLPLWKIAAVKTALRFVDAATIIELAKSQVLLIRWKEQKMTDHALSASRTITSVSARVRANSRRLATASVAALAAIILAWALIEQSRLPDAQKRSELFAVFAQAYP
jgi:hypothetical protein